MNSKLVLIFAISFVFISLLFPLVVIAGGGREVNISLESPSVARVDLASDKPSKILGFIDGSPKLGDIIAFHIALIAFLIPLSVEMVGRISERYGSGVVSNYYKREWVPWAILSLSLINVLYSVLLMFFSNSLENLNYISLVLFIITLILIVPYLWSLYGYLTDINTVIKKVTKDVKNII